MRSLKEFLAESFVKANDDVVVESSDTKIEFNFNGLEKAEETLKSLADANIKGVTVDEDDKKVSVKVDADNVDDLDTLIDILQQYGHVLRNSPKRVNDEKYAQLTITFMNTLNKVTDAIDEINGADNEEESEEKKEEE